MRASFPQGVLSREFVAPMRECRRAIARHRHDSQGMSHRGITLAQHTRQTGSATNVHGRSVGTPRDAALRGVTLRWTLVRRLPALPFGGRRLVARRFVSDVRDGHTH